MDGRTPETCAECGFDSRNWRRRDAVSLLEAYGYWWRLATDGVRETDLGHRPAPAVWSALEYGLHTAMVLAVLRTGIELIREEDGRTLPDPPEAPDASPGEAFDLDPALVGSELDRETQALGRLARRTGGWTNTGSLADGTVLQAEALVFHAVHDASHHQMDIGRGLAALGAGTPKGAGRVEQLNVSEGGVPKLPVAGAEIGWRGLSGDRQANRKHHGRPFQAVCLWSSETIEALASEGHPIGPGSAGENITVSGVDWAALRAGGRLRVGSALLELSFPSVPCHHQKQWFSDGDSSRIDHDLHPGAARWYAWVREPGAVRTFDPVVVQP